MPAGLGQFRGEADCRQGQPGASRAGHCSEANGAAMGPTGTAGSRCWDRQPLLGQAQSPSGFSQGEALVLLSTPASPIAQSPLLTASAGPGHTPPLTGSAPHHCSAAPQPPLSQPGALLRLCRCSSIPTHSPPHCCYPSPAPPPPDCSAATPTLGYTGVTWALLIASESLRQMTHQPIPATHRNGGPMSSDFQRSRI
ncbi:hypothetical protein KIL84_005637 [Mauremys mutica]|uniref:Uncharacterized protein n=1 Tax=Mauremys mutica TaxID=74926 RepID=A0A9D3XGN3_9SAUR|nr:hypothetical protein KIL84_005637 [Mauremys mutica]